MAFEGYMAASGPIVLGILIALGAALKWPTWVNYIWAAIAILWGIIGLV